MLGLGGFVTGGCVAGGFVAGGFVAGGFVRALVAGGVGACVGDFVVRLGLVGRGLVGRFGLGLVV